MIRAIKLLFLCLFFATFGTHTLFSSPAFIEVIGHAQHLLEPQTLEWHLKIETIAKTVNVSHKNNELVLKQLNEALIPLKLSKNSLKITHISMTKAFAYENRKRTEIGFKTQRHLTLTTPLSHSYSFVFQTLATVPDVVITTTQKKADTTQVQDKLNLVALKNAQKKADDMAAIYNLTRGPALEISEITSTSVSPQQLRTLEASSSSPAFEHIRVKSQVRVKFQLLNTKTTTNN